MSKCVSYYHIFLACILLGLVSLASCVSKKHSVYFRDLPDSVAVTSITPAIFKEPRILPSDLLAVTIQTMDPNTTVILNQISSSQSSLGALGTNSGSGNAGYLVSTDGSVDIPMLGKIQVSGMTIGEAKEQIKLVASKYFKEPNVQVRFGNFKVSVLGEVMRPSSYIVNDEKISILDAIALAGDLTIFGKRQNIMLIRDNGGKKDVVRLDLTSSNLMKSPYFYLKQNDVIYVEPSKGRLAANNSSTTQVISVVVSVLSLLVVIITRI